MRYKLLITFLSAVISCNVLAQDDLKKIIPPSPTAAALGQYGAVPVSYSAGIPSISVPLYEVNGKDLALSIDLSYHGGGIKVEEHSSWIGLGWSLNAGGVITRDTRGLPDDDAVGYFNNSVDPTNATNSQLLDAAKGLLDLEPDIFYYNFSSISGSFIYDKENSRFRTIPESNVSITFSASTLKWVLTADDGTVYTFNNRETTLSSNSCNPGGSAITTSWYVSKIVNYNKTDSIMFEYATPYSYHYYLLQGHTKYFITNYQAACSVFDSGLPTDCILDNTITAQRLTRITYRNGSVEFHANTSNRCDLSGDYALDRIDVKDKNGQTIYSYDFSQSYFSNGGTPCGSGADTDYFRLRLDSLNKMVGSSSERYRLFEYNESSFPHRQSFGQDYWGYYNGTSSGPPNGGTLIPTQVFLVTNGSTTTPMLYPGADRSPSTTENFAQIGMLKKIIYPTGGYTEFTYENHRVDGSFIPEYIPRAEHLDSYVTPSGTNIYSVSFTIDYGPNPLNGYNTSGGAIVSYLIDGITCDYDGSDGHTASQDCALITLSGTSGYSITGNLNNVFLPNGSYTLTADFSHNYGSTSTWEDFYVRVSWLEVNTATNHNAVIGGLRIKKIADYDPVTSKPFHQKQFNYKLFSDTVKSSAKIDLIPVFSRNINYFKRLKCPPPNTCAEDYYCYRQTLSASSNYPIVSLGLKLNYSNVTVTDDGIGSNGKTQYEFTNYPINQDTIYPYMPPSDLSWKNGQLLSEKTYVKSGSSFVLARQVSKTYKLMNQRMIAGVRFGNSIAFAGTDVEGYSYTPALSDYLFDLYQVIDDHFYNDSTITRTYDLSSGQFEETYEINKLSPVHFKPIYQESLAREGKRIISRFKYALDYSTPSASDYSSQGLLFQKTHNVNNLIEKSTWMKTGTDSILMSAQLDLYELKSGLLGKSKMLQMPYTSTFSNSSVQSGAFTYSSAYESLLEITGYDAIGNVTEGKGRDGVIYSFIWDSPGVQTIAKVVGSAKSQIFYTSFEDDVSNTSSMAVAGSKSHSGSYTVVFPGSGSKILTYWKKVGSGSWQLIQTTISGNTTIGTESGALIDEVRVYPSIAQMTTYTYLPGVGVSTINDPNNSITYYQYDSFSRLRLIKDKDGNILKKFQYNYKNQTGSNQ